MDFFKVELGSRFFLDMPLMDDIQNCAVHRNIVLKLPLPKVILRAYHYFINGETTLYINYY